MSFPMATCKPQSNHREERANHFVLWSNFLKLKKKKKKIFELFIRALNGITQNDKSNVELWGELWQNNCWTADMLIKIVINQH